MPLVGREKDPTPSLLPWLSGKLYLRHTGNEAPSRRSLQTAGRFPGSRSAGIRSTGQMTEGGQCSGRARGGYSPGQNAEWHPREAASEGKARPGSRG